MLTCQNCGHANPAQSNFCGNCGSPLAKERGVDDTQIISDNTRVIPVVTEDVVVVDDLKAEDQEAVKALRPGSALLIVRRPSLEERFLIDEPATTAGRHPKADIFLDDITVSRHHAEFTISPAGVVSVRDLGSLNGTYVNRKLVEEPVALRTGDEVQIGKFKMVCFVGGAGAR